MTVSVGIDFAGTTLDQHDQVIEKMGLTTLSAGPLGIHRARHGEIGFGTEIDIRQSVELRRPSPIVHARASGDGEGVESVEVGGRDVIVAKGRYRIAQS